MTREDIARELMRAEPTVKAFVRYLVGDMQDAEDLFQETAVAILQKDPESFPEDVEFVKYCRGIVRNLARHYWVRKKKSASIVRFEDVAESLETAYAEEDDHLDERNRWRLLLQRCLRKVAPASRQTLIRHYCEGVKIVQLAAGMKCSAGSLRIRLLRVRDALARCMRTLALEESHG